MPDQESPKVFISYSHDSPEHMDRVLALTNQLRAEGIDCDLDQYEFSPPEGWPNWMLRRLKWADFVLMICTETYRRRVEGEEADGVGRGVKWEGGFISQVIYQDDSLNTRFIPVVFSAADEPHIPLLVGGASRYRLDSDYEALYRHITNQSATPKPPLGKLQSLSPKPRVSFGDQIIAPSRNPFDPWRPVTPLRFHGRADLLKALARALDEQRSVSLVGDWRIGKTSLLATWGKRVAETGRGVRMLSGEGAEGSSISAFTHALTGLPSPDGADSAADVVEGWLASLGGLPPLVLVDECDRL